MKQEDIKNYVLQNSGTVSMKESSTYAGLFVLKYKSKVFYDSLWDEFLENCRGTIVDKDFNVITRPFNKAFNFRVESNAPELSDDTEVTAYRKVNGFFCAMTWYNNDILVSTTGSTDSEYVAMAKEMMLTHMPLVDWKMALSTPDCQGMTFMFEVVHPNDPHVIPEKSGLYFLGWRENTWDSKVHGYGKDMSTAWKEFAENTLHCYYAESDQATIGELVKLSKTCTHEGYMAYTKDGHCVKIKSPYYLFKKFIARKSPEKLINIIQKNAYKDMVGEEFYPMCEHLSENLEEFSVKTEQERLEYIRTWLSSNYLV
jgi:hypothetical protein